METDGLGEQEVYPVDRSRVGNKQVQLRGGLAGGMVSIFCFLFPVPGIVNSAFSGLYTLIKASSFREHSWTFQTSSSVKVREKGARLRESTQIVPTHVNKF